MSVQPDFLNQFQQKMDRLNAVRSGIQASVQSKEQFANYLKNRLQEINTGLKKLAGLINELKNKADNLERQISTNNATMSDKERQLQELSKQLDTLNNERNELIAKMSQQDNDTKGQMTQMTELQNKINNYEAQLRDLKQLSETQAGELNALRQEMSTTGTERDRAHLQELARLTELSKQQLAEQEAQLMQKIKECETKIMGFDQQIRDKETGFANRQREIEEKMMQAQNSGNALQSEITSLRNENQNLIQRLIDATNAINQSADDLQMLMADIPNAQSKQEIDNLLNSISQQMGQSIENISRAAQGHPMMPTQPMTQTQPQGVLPRQQPTQIDPNTKIRGMTYRDLMNGLIRKSSQFRGVNKYSDTINQLKNINDVGEIERILQNNSIIIKSGVFGPNVSGGKKNKRTIKQKGGFVYGRYSRKSQRNSSKKSKSRTSSRKISR
jgi:predicted  nucleic acid-binding Zn-ribbon protein